jgi:hypothetical protein
VVTKVHHDVLGVGLSHLFQHPHGRFGLFVCSDDHLIGMIFRFYTQFAGFFCIYELGFKVDWVGSNHIMFMFVYKASFCLGEV